MKLTQRIAGSRCGMVLLLVATAIACRETTESALEQLLDARRLSADLLVQFTKTGDAANRSVMAETEQAATAFAGEAEQSLTAVQKDLDALAPVLRRLGYAPETQLLDEFTGRFKEYQKLTRDTLGLAVQSTNVKAQRLSFGPAQQAADAVRDSLAGAVPSGATDIAWRLKALAATSMTDVREIQALQAPHIAEPDDAVMTRLEQRMDTLAADARRSIDTLAQLARPDSKAQLAAAASAFDRFMGLNAEIVKLSRENSNVRSLALSLGEKRTIAAACEDLLRALQDALAKRRFTSVR